MLQSYLFSLISRQIMRFRLVLRRKRMVIPETDVSHERGNRLEESMLIGITIQKLMKSFS